MSSLIRKGGKRPFLIAGPCSAETEEQVMETVQQLHRSVRSMYCVPASGKPRTRPDSFEGVGEEGLPWLVDAGKADRRFDNDRVAIARHVELALKAGGRYSLDRRAKQP